MKIGAIYDMCGASFFKELKDYEELLFAAILRCVLECASELFIVENGDFIDVEFRKSGETFQIAHVSKSIASEFCDFAAAAFPHKEITNFISDIDGFSIINLNGNLVHAFFYNYGQANQGDRVCYYIQLVFDESAAPQEAAVLAKKCRDEGLFT